MTSADAVALVRAVAMRVGRSDADILELWDALHSNIHALCGDGPLTGDYLALFRALESWEVAVGADREAAAEPVRELARNLPADG